jgi:hypothetical protein
MKKYSDYKEDCSDVSWTKFKIIVPTEEDRQEVMKAFKHIHDANIDTEYVTVNQLAHEYSPLYYDEKKKDPSTDPKNHNIIVDGKLYNKLSNSNE